MASKIRILTQDTQSKEKTGMIAYVVTGQNHLLQKRQFAFDGRDWFYQPTTRSPFQKVNPNDLPENVVEAMMAHTGFDRETLLG